MHKSATGNIHKEDAGKRTNTMLSCAPEKAGAPVYHDPFNLLRNAALAVLNTVSNCFDSDNSDIPIFIQNYRAIKYPFVDFG